MLTSRGHDSNIYNKKVVDNGTHGS